VWGDTLPDWTGNGFCWSWKELNIANKKRKCVSTSFFGVLGFHVVQFLLAEGAGRGEPTVENDALSAVGALAEAPEEEAEGQAENAEGSQQIECRGAGRHVCKKQRYDGNYNGYKIH
jgi:hypothetical protein